MSFDYGNRIYDNRKSESFIKKLGKVQYQASLAIAGAFQGTSHESLQKTEMCIFTI